MNLKLLLGYSTEQGAVMQITLLPTVRQSLSNIGVDFFKEVIKYSNQLMVNKQIMNKEKLYKVDNII